MLSDRRAHTTLPSSDVDALRPFYEEVLEFTPRPIARTRAASSASMTRAQMPGSQAGSIAAETTAG